MIISICGVGMARSTAFTTRFMRSAAKPPPARLPLSIYEFADEGAVDTVFRRINSGGRQLSRQELRSAGSIGHFATVVRRASAKVRGDDSYSDILRLNEMQAIIITNLEREYGINMDDIFRVNQGILSHDNVRQSRDEELVADIIAYMVSENLLSSRTEFLDDFYGMGRTARDKKDFRQSIYQCRDGQQIW
jgi:hypothetical protein